MIAIACVKWGDLYSADYVNILYDMVRRNLKDGVKGRFVCFTDNPEGLNEGIEIRSLPGHLTGWWNKLYLFRDGLFSEDEQVFYLDLDTVIVSSLDEILQYRGHFAILRDFYRPDGWGSGMMSWRGNSALSQLIWTQYEWNGFPSMTGGDQAFIEFVFANRDLPKPDLWQDLFPEQFFSYKVHAQKIFPKTAKIVCFHGHPRPHEVLTGWVPHLWKIGGGNALELETQGNTETNVLISNIQHALSLNLPLLDGVEAHDRHAVIVGGGPSLKDHWVEILERQTHGQDVFCVNNTANFLQSKAQFMPDYYVLLDSRENNVDFIPPSVRKNYLFASQCHPNVFDNTPWPLLYHCLADGIGEITAKDPRPTALVGGGSSVGLKAIAIAYILGYRTIHLYGFDSSYRDNDHHAYAQALNDNERVLDIVCNDKSYKAAAWMVTQAEEFKELAAELVKLGCTLTMHGDGLLPDIARLLAEPPEEDMEIVLKDGIYWPSKDVVCLPSMAATLGDIAKILPYCKKTEVAVQAGGNVGLWPKKLAETFDQVYTFEPDSLNFECLRRNINQAPNIVAAKSALGDESKKVSLRRNPSNCGAHFVQDGDDISVVTIDELELDRCDLIQLDVEGYELRALQGARQTLQKFKPVLVVEDNGLSIRYGIAQDAVDEWLLDYGYKKVANINRDKLFIAA